jgi:hypothetical protein
MKPKWLIVAAFYGLLIFAVAQPSSKAPDLLWIGAGSVIMLLMSACRLVEWLRNGRLGLPERGPLGWYMRFMTDSPDERAGTPTLTDQP